MTSIGNLQKKVKDFTEIEKKLWKAFNTAEKEYSIPSLNIWKANQLAMPFLKNKSLKITEYYPLLALITLLVAMVCPFYPVFFIAYILMLYLTMRSIDNYKNIITKHKLRDSNFVLHGFGINNLSLTIFGILNIVNAGGDRIDKNDIGSILKIVKARYETSDVSLGFAEHIKKLIYASLFTLPVAIFSNISHFSQQFSKALKVFNTNIYVSAYLALVIIFIIGLMYDLIFTQTKRKKQQKRYLLMLNIIHESWC